MKSDKGFRDFLLKDGQGIKFFGIVLLAALLLFLSAGVKSENKKVQDEEERAAEMCALMEGVGECRVMMTFLPESDGEEVYAVLVLCEGADSSKVREKVTSLFCSLYGIGANRVEIQKINQ